MQLLRRRFRPLIVNWVIFLVVAGLLYWLERELPALRDILTPIYIGLGLGLLYTAYRWMRKRASDRRARKDRRRRDRRSEDDQFVAGEG